MESMGSRIKHRRLRGLVRHHRRHPSAHPRRLVRRTRSWGERPVNGVCRWCGEHASSIQLTWHGYCLDAYRVASGQKPGHAAHDVRGLRGSCRRARPQARDQRRTGAGTGGPQTVVHAGEPAVALQLVPPAQDQARSPAGPVPVGVFDGLAASPSGPAGQSRVGRCVSCPARDCWRQRRPGHARGRPHRGIGGKRPPKTPSRGTGMGTDCVFHSRQVSWGSGGPQKSALRASCGHVFSEIGLKSSPQTVSAPNLSLMTFWWFRP